MVIQSADVAVTACECCGTERKVVKIFVGDDTSTRAAALVYCYPPHDADPAEIWIDAIVGSWGDDAINDHITFGCRFGKTEGQDDDACTLTDAAQLADSPICGQRLTREEALSHPQVSEFWSIVDLIFRTDPTVGEHRARFHSTTT